MRRPARRRRRSAIRDDSASASGGDRRGESDRRPRRAAASTKSISQSARSIVCAESPCWASATPSPCSSTSPTATASRDEIAAQQERAAPPVAGASPRSSASQHARRRRARSVPAPQLLQACNYNEEMFVVRYVALLALVLLAGRHAERDAAAIRPAQLDGPGVRRGRARVAHSRSSSSGRRRTPSFSRAAIVGAMLARGGRSAATVGRTAPMAINIGVGHRAARPGMRVSRVNVALSGCRP